MSAASSYDRIGPEAPKSPVIISVPHAGRVYPPEFQNLARLPISSLRSLEDRLADALVPDRATALVARIPRAWIDLNRSERDFDPTLIAGGHALGAVPSAKVRGGLGLIPRRLARQGEIWRGRLSAQQLQDRIELHHRPFHRQLAALIDHTIASFGIAILVDLHSMPTLPQPDPPSFVVGDLFGRSAHGRFAQIALGVLGEGGDLVALNSPYAGGHILERHSRPHRNVHALQLEVERRLYLDEDGDGLGAGLQAVKARIASLIDALAEEALSSDFAAAAE